MYESVANTDLARILQGMAGSATVEPEPTDVFPGGKRPDLLITAPGRSPVVIEARRSPAANLEEDAAARFALNAPVRDRELEAVIALRYPAGMTALDADTLLEYVAFTRGSGGGLDRFPELGWLPGKAADLADLVSLVSVPQLAVDRAADALERGIGMAARRLDEAPGTTPHIARLLGMDDVPQTRRMACAIIANAMVFHSRIERIHTGIKKLEQACASATPKSEVRDCWDEILNINYWPIFAIGKDILRQISPYDAAPILRMLMATVEAVSSTGIDNAHDLTGRVFQRLISDRKYLATFYTLPPSAALLARLAVAKLRNFRPPQGEGGGEFDWSDADAIGRLRIGDFACGTGALLSAAYQQVADRYDRAGGDSSNLHSTMIEEVLYGCDVMPSAVHITSSTLSGIEPAVQFNNSRLYTLAYGRQQDGDVRTGSLELLQSSAAMTLFNTSDPAMRTGSRGEETAAQIVADISDGGFDLVLMNPPFTSNTKHRDSEGNVQNAAFAAFGALVADQDDMAARLGRLAEGSYYHGHAGLGSAFASIADKKLRPGGVLGLVLPFTAINGASWAKFRELIATQYTDVTIVSIAANGTDMSFSSDTGIAECLVIARKIGKGEEAAGRGQFVSLTRRPPGLAASWELSKAILADSSERRLEDGPYSGLPLYVGTTPYGEVLDCPLNDYETGWSAARIADASVAQTAFSLSAGKPWLPTQPQSLDLPIAPLRDVGQRGADSQLFVSSAHNGPFVKNRPSPTATYPALWNHNARNETRIVCAPDSQLRVIRGMESRAAELWATASRAHISRGFRFNSQSLAIAFTDRESIGGRAWPNMEFTSKEFDYAFAVWGNSTLGLLSYWWHSSRQQAGRGDMTIRAIDTLPVLDFRALSGEQLAVAETIFDEFRGLELQPAYLADADANRALLDRRVVCDLLGLDEDVYRAVRLLAAKWCAEPSVHGGKRRPVGVQYVE